MEKDLKCVDPRLAGYTVSDQGVVYSKYSGLPMYGSLTHSGHVVVTIYGKAYRVHRLVAECFVPHIRTNETTIHHINHDKQDNRACNLVWVTPEHHNKLHGGVPKMSLRKLTEEDRDFVREHYIPRDRHWSVGALAQLFGVSKSTIIRVLHGDNRA